MADAPGSLVELRVLEGPNLYFPRAAIKLTLDISGLAAVPEDTARRFAARIGLRNARPGAPDSGFRQRFALRAVGRLVRAITAESGATRLAVRVRPTSDPHRIVVAYPWVHRNRAQVMGTAIAEVLDAIPGGDTDRVVDEVAARVAAAEPGAKPHTLTPRIPVVAVTGTNGKTTTSRMIAHIARADGRHVGWSSTDGIYVDGELVEAGDYSGPSGAGRVLAQPGVQLAVTETARGGILLKGIGVARNDVSVVTNVTADHLGLHGIDTLEQLAEVKSVVPKITRRSGWAVLNGDDPRVLAMRAVIKAQPWVFSRDPDAPAIRVVLDDGGRATTVIDGWISVLAPNADPDPLVELVDVPMTLSGLSRFNVENALAAASAALAVGIPRDRVVEGLRTFEPGPEHNWGRLNIFSVPRTGGAATVIIDNAHNEASLESLTEVAAGLRAPGGRLLLGLGAVGDRTEELTEALGEIGARAADVVAIGHKKKYLRGRTEEELEELLRAGAARVGVTDVPAYPTEVDCLAALVGQSLPGDVIALMTHAEHHAVFAWLEEHGATVDSPDVLREKVRAARAQDSGAASAGT
ncbi:Mur ligase family protein [Nocardioides anomalus]|uniref:Mur ligase family protein n=1 Tax=Nocardioides anomalus TaxID=2712223 RepID=UPI001E373725|nr:Mur ligase family protein [Nocardioides anomalus]